METSSRITDETTGMTSGAGSSLAHPDGTASGTEDAEASTLDPTTTAVVVVDVQRLFTDLLGIPVAPPLDEVLPRIGRLIEEARRSRATVILVRTIIAPEDHSRSTLQWPEFMRANLAPGSPGAEFDPCVDPRPGDIEIIKQRYSAFAGTSLATTLNDRGISSLVILGLTTNVCVQSTARDGWQLDYRTITLSDCCSEVGEGSHEASLAWTARNFGEVSTSEDVIRRLQTSAAVAP